MLHFLVEACRVNLEALTYGGFTALQLAMMNRRYDVVELLQQLGAVASPLPDSDMDTSSDSDAEVSGGGRLAARVRWLLTWWCRCFLVVLIRKFL